MYDCIVIGAGAAGATVARQIAEKGKKVLVLDKRAHIAGNTYECFDNHGIRVHKYGPHIFHTNNKTVVDFLSHFTEFYAYEHRVLGSVDGKLVPIPFNFTSIEKLFAPEKAKVLIKKLTDMYNSPKVSVLELLQSDDAEIKALGEYVYEKVFVHYTAKQWGIPIGEVDTSVINRVPVVCGYDDRYFSDDYQLMPKDGFTVMFENILAHPNITVELNRNATDLFSFGADGINFNGERISCPVVFTGAVDELLNYRFGVLPYRSLTLSFEHITAERFQPAAVVNYPNDEAFTRITEFKYLTNQKAASTTILREYPTTYNINGLFGNIPYYVIENKENRALHTRYADFLRNYPNIYLCGRLAEYKYYNIDACVLQALHVAEEIKF